MPWSDGGSAGADTKVPARSRLASMMRHFCVLPGGRQTAMYKPIWELGAVLAWVGVDLVHANPGERQNSPHHVRPEIHQAGVQ